MNSKKLTAGLKKTYDAVQMYSVEPFLQSQLAFLSYIEFFNNMLTRNQITPGSNLICPIVGW